jgi:hypothetical protein
VTWKEVKKAVEDAGIAEEDEVSVIQCQAHKRQQDSSQAQTWQFRKAHRRLFGESAKRRQWMYLLSSKE